MERLPLSSADHARGLATFAMAAGVPSTTCPSDHETVIRLWRSAAPPPGLLIGGDEGISEIDVVIEAATWVWFIEAKYTSDISLGTTTRPDRDQVLRNIDVGSYYAGVRQFFFSLLVSSEERSPEGTKRMRRIFRLIETENETWCTPTRRFAEFKGDQSDYLGSTRRRTRRGIKACSTRGRAYLRPPGPGVV